MYEFTFTRGGARIQIGDTGLWEEDMAPENDDRLYYVEDIFREKGDQVIYTYDLGDDWRHQVKLIDIQDDPFQYPVLPCVLGVKGVCPPEDCGGPHGYTAMMNILSDIHHPDYDATDKLLYQLGWRPSQPTPKKLQNALNKYKADMWKQYMQ